MEQIELHIIALSNSESQPGNYALILEEAKGIRRLPIIVGAFEAQAIAIALEQMEPNRPLTHDLFKNTLLAAKISLDKVVIGAIKDGVFHAELIGKLPTGEPLRVDARASDAIAMAIRFDCPVLTNDVVLKEAGIILDNLSKSFTNKRGQLEDYTLDELERLLQQVLAKEDYKSAVKIRNAIDRKKESS